MEKEVSVIVPIHGVGKYLKKCLDSLINQDFNLPYEIICVSDNCCDNSDEIIDFYLKKYPKLFVKISVCNKNLCDTRNDGLKIANGKYILFVDGDDSVLKSYISKLYECIRRNDLDIGCSNYYNVEEGKEDIFIKEFTSYFCLKKETNLNKAKNAFALDVRMRSFVWNKIYKKEFLIKNNIVFFKKFIPCEDFIFNFICFSKTKKNVGFTNYRGYLYLQRNVSYTKKIKDYKIIDGLINAVTFIKCYELLNKNRLFNYRKIYFSKKFLLEYYLISNKENFEDYNNKKKEYTNKFRTIVKSNSIYFLDNEVVDISKCYLNDK